MADSYFFLLKGELIELGRGEIRALIRTYQPEASISNLATSLVLAEGNLDAYLKAILTRAAFTRFGGRLLHLSSDLHIGGLDLPEGYETFACKTIDLTGRRMGLGIASELGRYVKQKAPWLRVSLDRPDLILLLIAMEQGHAIGLVEGHASRRSIRPRERAYFHPAVLKPRLCRAMINLTMVKEGGIILDPFCGTGGILLEAMGMQINAVGCDLSREMCGGALENLRACNESLVVNSDALNLPFRMERIDAVVTDLPYGRAASTSGRKPGEILDRFLDLLKTIGKERSCIMCSKAEAERVQSAHMVEQYDIYEHKSLTRRLMVVCS